MRFRIRRQPDGTWLERELLRRAWTYQGFAHHAGISRMTLYFLCAALPSASCRR